MGGRGREGVEGRDEERRDGKGRDGKMRDREGRDGEGRGGIGPPTCWLLPLPMSLGHLLHHLRAVFLGHTTCMVKPPSAHAA